MKKLDFSQTITVLANLGVIAGIAFLAFEVRQNNQFLAAQVSYAHHEAERQRRSPLITNDGGITEIVVKSVNGEELTPVEDYRLLILYNNLLEDFEWQFGEVQAGRLPEDRLNVSNWRGVWSQPRMRQNFEQGKANRDPAFVEYWQENVVDVVNERRERRERSQ